MIWAFLLNNPLARLLGKVAAVILAVVTFGAWQRRQGAQAAKADHIEAEAKADQQAHERINNAETGSGATDGERIERLRDFAAKHGNGSAKRTGR